MEIIIRSRVPLRISFAGGGTDVSPYYDLYGGVVISATITRYATVTLKPRKDNKIIVSSIDYDITVEYSIDEHLAYDGQLDLIKGVINHFNNSIKLPSGFEIMVHNDAPPGSGLGSSSAVCVALIGAFKEWLNLPLTSYDIAELAYKIERIELRIKGGKQDQYAAAFGGFNFMEFYKDKTIVNPLRLKEEIVNELNYSLVLAYIGGSHNSSKILSEQIENVKSRKQESMEALHNLKEVAIEMKNYLVMGKLGKFAQLLNMAWMYKRQMANGITNDFIDNVYKAALDAGAIGGKISGAGGGGYMFFFVKPDKRYSVIQALKSMKAQIVNYTFENDGLVAWKINEI